MGNSLLLFPSGATEMSNSDMKQNEICMKISFSMEHLLPSQHLHMTLCYVISAGNGRNVVFVTLFTLRLLATSAPEAHVYLHRIRHYNSQCCSHSPQIPHLIGYIPSTDFVAVIDAAGLTLSFAYLTKIWLTVTVTG